MVTKKCVQCGNEFTLTDGEIDFYKSKNLNLPKRCKECRDKNKDSKPTKLNNSAKKGATIVKVNNGGSASSNSGLHLGKFAWLIALLMVVVFVVAIWGITQNTSVDIDDNSTTIYNTTTEAYVTEQTAESTTQKVETTTKRANDSSSSTKGDGFEIEFGGGSGSGNSNSGGYSSGGYNGGTVSSGNTSSGSVNAGGSSNNSVTENYSSRYYRFANQNLLTAHYQKHGAQVGATSESDYVAKANAVVNNPNALTKTEAEDGDTVYFLKSTGEIVFVSTRGYIRTYFIADYAYFQRR